MLLSIAVSAWSLTYGRSWVARERFMHVMSKLADDIEDAILDGRLPDNQAVRFEWYKARILSDMPRLVSFSRLVALDKVSPIAPPKRRTRTYAGLKPQQRKLLHEFDGRWVDEVSLYIQNGSRWWFVIRPLTLLAEYIANKEHRVPTKAPKVAQAHDLAENFNRVVEKTKVRSSDGSSVFSPGILACA